jgi:hypothetical protein
VTKSENKPVLEHLRTLKEQAIKKLLDFAASFFCIIVGNNMISITVKISIEDIPEGNPINSLIFLV